MAEDRSTALMNALRAEGCALRAEDAGRVAAAAGVADLAPLMAALVDAGLAEVASPEVTMLVPLACAGQAPPAALSLVVAAAKASDCVLPLADATRAVARLGAREPEATAAIAILLDAGEAWIEGPDLHLVQRLCHGLPGAPAMTARREAEAAEWVESRLRDAPGCRLSRGALALDGVAVGIAPSDIDRAMVTLAARDRLAVAGAEPALAACP